MMQETAGAQQKDTNHDQASLLQHLTTESQNEASQGFDTKSALEIARIINHEDSKVAAAVKKAIPEIAQVIDQVARSLRDGGRLIYIGAGSSGRIAASTLRVSTHLLHRSRPGAVHHGWRTQGPGSASRSMRTPRSSASGISPAAAPPAKMSSLESPPLAALLMLWPLSPMHAHAEPIPPPSPAIWKLPGRCRRHRHHCRRRPRSHLRFHPHEGRNRQKTILNMITTGAMTRLGYVYENLMVNVHMQNSKLVERGIRILMELVRSTASPRSTPSERRPQRTGRPGHAQGRSRQARSRSPPRQIRWQRPPRHRDNVLEL